jgi:peptidoglycan/xylan/chitin deacetylase (PgdA/CDA1 family)
MAIKIRFGRPRCFYPPWIILMLILLGGCATPKVEGPAAPPSKVEAPGMPPPRAEAPAVPLPSIEPRVFPDFVALIAQEGDTFSSLASRYLRDGSKDWFIAEFNRLSVLSPGQELIIPLKPFERGGLTLKGYQTVPVLSYHNFSLDKSPNKMTVTQAAFEEQMKLLKEMGYRVITLDELLDFLEFKGQIPKKSVVITIDDGWRSLYEIAFPILKKYGYPATLFIYTDLITGSPKTLSWELIQEMAREGLDIQGHTKSHRNLSTIDKKETFQAYFESIERELSESSRIIKAKMGKEIKYLAYPNGETNHLVIELVRKKGYAGAFTVKRGGNPAFVHDYRINRSMIYGDLNLNQFEKNLTVFSDEALK